MISLYVAKSVMVLGQLREKTWIDTSGPIIHNMQIQTIYEETRQCVMIVGRSTPGAAICHGISSKQSMESMELGIDPDERRYCLCNRTAFGEMIGCRNNDVSSYCHLKVKISKKVLTVLLVRKRVVPSRLCWLGGDSAVNDRVVLP
jgi:hypothetical protein